MHGPRWPRGGARTCVALDRGTAARRGSCACPEAAVGTTRDASVLCSDPAVPETRAYAALSLHPAERSCLAYAIPVGRAGGLVLGGDSPWR